MVAVVFPFQSRPEPLVQVSRADALRFAPVAAKALERELAELERELIEQEYAKRQRWNRHWFVRLLPFLKADARREAIDVWDTGGGDTLSNMDNVFELHVLSYYIHKLHSLTFRARNASASELPVEQDVANKMMYMA
jgi:hypothetical protein